MFLVTSWFYVRYLFLSNCGVSPNNIWKELLEYYLYKFCYFNVGDLMIPENTIAQEGTPVTIYCRRRSQEVTWHFVEAGSGVSVVIADNCQPVPALRDMFRIDNSDDACNLIIDSVTLDHAGSYSCQAVPEDDQVTNAQLIVYGESKSMNIIKFLSGNSLSQKFMFIPKL